MNGQLLVPTQRFLFDRRFDVQAAAAVVAEEPPVPVFSAADLEQARTEGMALGRADALSEIEARLQHECRSEATLQAIAERLGTALVEIAAAADQAGRDAVLVAAAIARKHLPELYARQGASEIEALVTAVLAELPDERQVSVRLAPGMLGELGPQLQRAAEDSGHGDRFRLSADAGIGAGDCALEWAGGGLLRQRASLWRDIEALIDEAGGAPVAADAGRGDGHG